MLTLVWAVLASALIAGALAVGLILSQPVVSLPEIDGLDFSDAIGKTVPWPGPELVSMRDGFALSVRRFNPAEPPVAGGAGTDVPLVILVHGSGWHGQQFSELAPQLRERAQVLVPDLRGHGASPGRRGDVGYIGQLEDDLADLIAAYQKPGQAVVLIGHSSGGGLVVRFAGGAYGGQIDRAVLLAPFLKYDAPTTRLNSGGWAYPLTRRIIGLSMLNAARIRGMNYLPVIQFNMPIQILDGALGGTATVAYSYRLNTSYAPRRDYLTDVGALPPFTLVAGARDEAFDAAGYEPLMSPVNANGRYVIVPGVGHLAIVDAPQTQQAILEILGDL